MVSAHPVLKGLEFNSSHAWHVFGSGVARSPKDLALWFGQELNAIHLFCLFQSLRNRERGIA